VNGSDAVAGPARASWLLSSVFLDSDKSLRTDEIAGFMSPATQQPDDDATSKYALLDHVVTPVWGVSASATSTHASPWA